MADLSLRLRDVDPGLADSVLADLAATLTGRLVDLWTPTVHAEYLAAVRVRHPFGATEGEIAALLPSFVAQLTARMPVAYPEGERIGGVLVRHWADAAVELLGRLRSARRRLVAAGLVPAAATLTGLAGTGDPHHGGRTVTVLTFDDGRQVVAKPRSVLPELLLGGLYGVVAIACGEPATGWPTVVDLGDHGFVGFVRADGPRPPGSPAFARRGGILLAVARHLGAGDLHVENVFRVDDGPVVIDAEVLLPGRTAVTARHPDPAESAFETSVWATALLPTAVPLGRSRITAGVAHLGGLGVAGTLDTDALLDGYRAATEVLLGGHPEVTSAVQAARRTPGRQILRHTSTYAAALTASTSPASLRSADHRRTVLLGRLPDPVEPRQLDTELSALWDLDIPLFTGIPEEIPVADPRGPSMAAAALAVPYPAVTDRAEDPGRPSAAKAAGAFPDPSSAVRAPDPAAPDRSGTDARTATRTGTVSDGQPQPTVVPDRETILGRVADLVALVATAAYRRGDAAGWLGVRRDPLSGTTSTGAIGPGLLTGAAGIAVFLAEAARVYGDADAADLARSAIRTATRIDAYRAGQPGSPTDPGLSAGSGGLVWALSRLSVLLDDTDLAESALQLVTRTLDRLGRRPVRLDLDGGLAGLLVGVRALTDIRHDAVDLVPAVVERMMVPPPMSWADLTLVPGAAYGAIGVAAAAGGDPRVLDRLDLTGPLHSGGDGWETGSTGLMAAVRRCPELSVLQAGSLQAEPSQAGSALAELPDPGPAGRQLMVHGLRRGVAGRVVVLGGEDPGDLLQPPGHLRLLGPGVEPQWCPELGDGAAGVGLALLAALDPAVRTPLVFR
ncbi:DUF4135 domain-containing protein [Nakamurella sp. YIM 132087]|uniref:DUF4135 domain-containing protein n=1 Tax=Nakamurella alba TaxID=2665158 RepID=A0A7K1FS01_9ACTN|nr:DUF4135 domain-containing protein [Nakamurella alba]MTD16850.1 DUF4135 domain-containing protein [Nakamurella alba]